MSVGVLRPQAYNLWQVWVFCFFKKEQKNKKKGFIIILLSASKRELRVINRKKP